MRSVTRGLEDHENSLEGGGRVGKRRKGHLTHLARPAIHIQVGVPLSEPSLDGCLAPLQAEAGSFDWIGGSQRRSFLHSSYMFRDRVA